MAPDNDDPWLRPVWIDDAEDEAASEGGTSQRPLTSGERRGAALRSGAHNDLAAVSPALLLLPLARAQDAVARLEAALEAASPDVRQGLRARRAPEAAGWLALPTPLLPCTPATSPCARPGSPAPTRSRR